MSIAGYTYFDNSNTYVNVEIVLTTEEKEMGLMDRTFLPENSGMLFMYDIECIHNIWMKNMYIPLDIIWIDGRYTIIHIEKNLMPCYGYCQEFGPELYSRFALELNGGYTNEHHINIGDKVRIIF